MGSCFACFPQQAVPPRGVAYISHPCEVRFANYAWGEASWQCFRCNASWVIVDVSHASLSTREIATHAGGEVRQWAHGEAGYCPCGVQWTLL